VCVKLQGDGGAMHCICESNVSQTTVPREQQFPFFLFSSRHYDKAVIARMAGVDKTSTTASNEGVKLAARFVWCVITRAQVSSFSKIVGVRSNYMYKSPKGRLGGPLQRGLPLFSVRSHVSFCATLSPGGYSWCKAGIITALANGTHTSYQRLFLKSALQLTG
jgi:hypothetical protein